MSTLDTLEKEHYSGKYKFTRSCYPPIPKLEDEKGNLLPQEWGAKPRDFIGEMDKKLEAENGVDFLPIEKDVKIPTVGQLDESLPSEWPIHQMDVGDSFRVKGMRNLDAAWYQRCLGLHIESKCFRIEPISSHLDEYSHRVWRTK